MGYAFQSDAFENLGKSASSVRHTCSFCHSGHSKEEPSRPFTIVHEIAVDQADQAFHQHVSASLKFEISKCYDSNQTGFCDFHVSQGNSCFEFSHFSHSSGRYHEHGQHGPNDQR
jgi:hypothetical protein